MASDLSNRLFYPTFEQTQEERENYSLFRVSDEGIGVWAVMREFKGIFATLLVQANSICVPLSKFNEGVSGMVHEPKK